MFMLQRFGCDKWFNILSQILNFQSGGKVLVLKLQDLPRKLLRLICMYPMSCIWMVVSLLLEIVLDALFITSSNVGENAPLTNRVGLSK